MTTQSGFQFKLLKKIALFSAVIVIVFSLGFYFLFKEYFNKIYLVLLVFNILITFFICSTLFRSYLENPKRFSNAYMLALFAKFMIYILFFGLYVFLNKDNAIPFTVVFLTLYILFTAFEIKEILSFSKIKS